MLCVGNINHKRIDLTLFFVHNHCKSILYYLNQNNLYYVL